MATAGHTLISTQNGRGKSSGWVGSYGGGWVGSRPPAPGPDTLPRPDRTGRAASGPDVLEIAQVYEGSKPPVSGPDALLRPDQTRRARSGRAGGPEASPPLFLQLPRLLLQVL